MRPLLRVENLRRLIRCEGNASQIAEQRRELIERQCDSQRRGRAGIEIRSQRAEIGYVENIWRGRAVDYDRSILKLRPRALEPGGGAERGKNRSRNDMSGNPCDGLRQ